MPTFVHAMVCFACIFLLKQATKRQDGLVETGLVSDLAARLVAQFRSMKVGKWHLAHMMADGLERSAASLLGDSGPGVPEGHDVGVGSGRGKGGPGSMTSMGDTGPEDTSGIAFGLYADLSASSFQGPVSSGLGGVGVGSVGMQSMQGAIQSPDVAFGPQDFFEFSTGPPDTENESFGFP
jgi:hypothetical protein